MTDNTDTAAPAKVLYISLMGMGQALGRGQVLEYLKELAATHHVWLLSFEKDCSEDLINSLRTEMAEANIEWHHLRYSNRWRLISSLKQILSAVRLAGTLIRNHSIEIIHARSMIPAVIGVCLKWRHRTRLIFDIRGFQMDEKADVGRLKRGSLLYRVLKAVETRCYIHADAIVSLTRAALPIIARHTSSDKCIFIPTCTDPRLFHETSQEDQREMRAKLGYAEDDIVLIHAGAVTVWYDFIREAKLVKAMMDLDPRVRYLVLNRHERAYIEEQSDRAGISRNNLTITSCNLHEMHRYLSIADASIFLITPSFAKTASTPTKFGENLACRLPSITNKGIGDMDEYLEHNDVGYIFDLESIDHDVDAIASNALKMLQCPIDARAYDKLFDETFDKSLGVARYSTLYQKLAREAKA